MRTAIWWLACVSIMATGAIAGKFVHFIFLLLSAAAILALSQIVDLEDEK